LLSISQHNNRKDAGIGPLPFRKEAMSDEKREMK
jgi:hypothetical protein